MFTFLAQLKVTKEATVLFLMALASLRRHGKMCLR